MFTLLGWVLQLMAFVWQPAQAILDTEDDVATLILPHSASDDASDISKELQISNTNAKFEIDDSQFRKFAETVKGLYSDTKWNDAKKFREFALQQTQVSEVSSSLTPYEKFLLEIFALTYEIIHPGTSTDFLSHVKQSITVTLEDWTLEDFAEDLFFMVKLGEPKKALNCDNCADYLTTGVPEKVLQSWIMVNVLQIDLPAIHDKPDLLKIIVTSILKTSIEDIVKDFHLVQELSLSKSHHKVGALLRLIEVLYSCQRKKKMVAFADANLQAFPEPFQHLARSAKDCVTKPVYQQGTSD